MSSQRFCVFLNILFLLENVYGNDPLEGNLPRFDCVKRRAITPCKQTFIEAYNNSSLAQSDPKGGNDADTWFLLYTPQNTETAEYLDQCGTGLPENTLFDKEKETIFVIHGYLEGVCAVAWMREYKDQFLIRGAYNIILVDWAWGAGPDYRISVVNGRVVGKQIGFLINLMKISTGINVSVIIHLVGHSLGAHIAGFAGKTVKLLTGKKIRRITGLDPAGPAFNGVGPRDRLARKDAKIVDIIHTNSGECPDITFGYGKNLGTSDFRPNGGTVQLSCIPYTLYSILKGDITYALLNSVLPFGFHKQSVQYFKVSINSCHCEFIAVRCQSYEDFKSGKCHSCGDDGSNCAVMGMDHEFYPWKPGNESYFLDTTLVCPYCDNSKINIQGFKPNRNFPRKCFPDSTS